MFGERLHQVDYRIARNFRYGGVRIQPQFDLYNLFNANTILQYNNNYGASWQQPINILIGRMAKFGVQVNF
jgi:hypothetical protein